MNLAFTIIIGLFVGFAVGYLLRKKSAPIKVVYKESISKEHFFSIDLLKLCTGKINSETVSLREILESEKFNNSKSSLTLALGRDIGGIVALADLKEILHILMSGATGSGKSVLINDMILSLIYQNNPDDLRLILIDPKRVEFIHYNNIPYLLCPVIYDVDKSVSALRWAVTEIDRRFHILEDAHYRNIDNYNQSQSKVKLPHIVIFIDEFSDLMAQAGNEVEAAVVRIAQMCKAVGIHLIIATSRPSTDVITSIIKSNMINRIGLAVASQIDSLKIMDTLGAEKLLGKGDILFGNAENGYKRIQVSLVTDKEIHKVTDFLKAKGIKLRDILVEE